MRKAVEGVDYVKCTVCGRVLFPEDAGSLGRCVWCRRKPVPEPPVPAPSIEAETGPGSAQDAPESTIESLDVRQGADGDASPVEHASAVFRSRTMKGDW